MTAQVFCDYDLQMKRMIVKDIKVFTEMHLIKQCVCPLCKQAMNIHSVMTLLANESKDSEEVNI